MRKRNEIASQLREVYKNNPESARPFLEKGLNAGFLKGLGFSAKTLKEEFGFNAYILRELNFKAKDLANDFSPLMLVQAGFNAAELKEAGIDARQLRVLGARKMLDIGFGVMDLKQAGISRKVIEAALKKRKRQGFN